MNNIFSQEQFYFLAISSIIILRALPIFFENIFYQINNSYLILEDGNYKDLSLPKYATYCYDKNLFFLISAFVAILKQSKT